MPRRTRLKRNTQKSKHLKRPRSWHRTSKVPLSKIMIEIREIKREAKLNMLHEFCREIKCGVRTLLDKPNKSNEKSNAPFKEYCINCTAFKYNNFLIEKKEAG